MDENAKVEAIMEILKKYLVPAKDHSGMKASDVAKEILAAIGA